MTTGQILAELRTKIWGMENHFKCAWCGEVFPRDPGSNEQLRHHTINCKEAPYTRLIEKIAEQDAHLRRLSKVEDRLNNANKIIEAAKDYREVHRHECQECRHRNNGKCRCYGDKAAITAAGTKLTTLLDSLT